MILQKKRTEDDEKAIIKINFENHPHLFNSDGSRRIRFICDYKETRIINGVTYGINCFYISEKSECRCIYHKNLEQKKFDLIWTNYCESIIKKQGTGVTPAETRKGLQCGKFIQENEKFCKPHIKTQDKPTTNLRCVKVRALPNKETRKLLDKFFGANRKIYNTLVEKDIIHEFNKDNFTTEDKNSFESTYKNKYITNGFSNGLESISHIPKDVRADSVNEYFTACSNAYNIYLDKIKSEEWKKDNIVNYTKKTIKFPEMKFKLKREQQSICLQSRFTKVIKKDSTSFVKKNIFNELKNEDDEIKNTSDIFIEVYPRTLPAIKLHNRCKRNKTLQKILNDDIKYDYKLIKTKTNKYYFCFVYSAEIQINTSKMQMAFDGGIDKFYTGYSPQGKIIEYGCQTGKHITIWQDEIKTLNKKCFNKHPYKASVKDIKKKDKKDGKIRYINKKINNNYVLTKSKKDKSSTRKYRLLLQEKLQNRINDLHFKTAHDMCTTNNVVIVPHFGVKNMIKKKKNKKIGEKDLPSCVKRTMLTLSHGKFRNRLISKGLISGCTVIIPPNERLTTKTCGICFKKIEGIGASKIVYCPNCDLKTGRDHGAPRLIFLRQIKIIDT